MFRAEQRAEIPISPAPDKEMENPDRAVMHGWPAPWNRRDPAGLTDHGAEVLWLLGYLTVMILLEKEALLPSEAFPNLFFLRILWLPSSLMRLPEETKAPSFNA